MHDREAAQAHFREQGFNTLRGEVRFWQAMFGLAFWGEIFDGSGAPNALNDIPPDLFSGAQFYEARRARMDQKATAISRSNVAEFVAAQLHAHGDTWTRIIFEGPRGDFSYRRVLEGAEVREFLSVIDAGIFAKVVRRIASNPNENRAGLPDYMVWRKKEVIFIEVKGIRETIRDSQLAWLYWMQSEGIPASVVRIKGVRVGAETASTADC
jgi:DNA polymerase-3 subunit epsilon